MAKINMPLAVDLEYSLVGGSTKTLTSYMQNAVVTKDGDRHYVEKRKGFEQIRTTANKYGYGGKYWRNSVTANYFSVETDTGTDDVKLYLGTSSRTAVTRSSFSGAHDGGNNEAALTDSDASFGTDDLVGLTINNTTDGSAGTITANTPTTITATLSGGTDNDWDTGDAYTIAAGGAFTFQGTWPEYGSDISAVTFQDNGEDSLVVHGFVSAVSTENIVVLKMDGVTPRVYAEITTVANNFPDVSAGYYTCPGLVELDGYIFVGMITGEIFNCPLSNVTGTWVSTDYLSSERENDTLRWICKHNNNLVAVGDSSIEFFYNAGNPGGSPLSRREDVFYDIGVAQQGYTGNKPAAASNDEILVFVGSRGYDNPNQDQTLGVYMIENFQMKKISNQAMDAFVTPYTRVSIISVHDRTLVMVTEPTSSITYYYDVTSGLWAKLTLDGNTTPDVFDAEDGWMNVFDGAYLYHYKRDWVSDGITSTDEPIPFEIVTQEWDGGSVGNKFINAVTVVGQHSWSADASNISVSWSDDGGENYTTARDVDLVTQDTIYRCGITRRRKWKLSHTDSEPCRLERLEIDGTMVAQSRNESS